MDTYEALIRLEEAKLTLLRQKVAACEQRITALRTLAQTDDVDDAIASAVERVAADRGDLAAAPVEVLAPGTAPPWEAKGDGRKVRSDSVVIDVLSLLRGGVKSLDEVDAHLVSVGRSRSRGYLRTALMNWRVNNGWVQNPQPGRYGLTKVGEAFLDANKGESPSTVNAEAFNLQPSPSSGTATVGVRRRVVTRRSA